MRTNSRLRLFSTLLATILSAAPASATWSIVFVNKATREVVVGTATCLAGTNLQLAVPVVRVGEGAGAAQNQIDVTAANRRIMRDGLRDGLTPFEIRLDLIANGVTPGRRQYGIAAFSGPAETWTGQQTGLAYFGVTGEVGDISYAIQGNVLVGDEVVLAAEEALRNATGDSGQRLMAAMKAAARLGGDGRCSCDGAMPTSCGVPPDHFEKSAHVGVMIVARVGDPNGGCNANNGCASGDYYMVLNYSGGMTDPDPVLELQTMHEAWRADKIGLPDGILSSLSTSADRAPADGESTIEVVLRLADVNGDALTSGGALIEVTPSGANPTALFEVGAVLDHGDGSYSFNLKAGDTVGVEDFTITADDGVEKATLYPGFSPELVPAVGLTAGAVQVSLSGDKELAFVLNEPLAAHAPYWILGSSSGAHPGLRVADLTIPLNPDAWFLHTLVGGADLIGTAGVLDANGRAEATWEPTSSLLAYLGGTDLHWAAITFDGALRTTTAVSVEVLP